MIKTIIKSVLGRQEPPKHKYSVVRDFTRGNMSARIIEKRGLTGVPEYLIDVDLYAGGEMRDLAFVRVKDLFAQLDLLQQADDYLSKRMYVR